MKENVYIFGHKNPDTDSVCSAIAYANLKNTIDSHNNYIPIVIGDINKETEYVLAQVNIEKPTFFSHLKPQILDMTFEPPKYVTESASIKEILDKLTNDYGRILPVIGSHNHLIGVVSISDVLPLYMSGDDPNFLCDSDTPYSNLIEQLDLTIIRGTLPTGNIKGKVLLEEDIIDDVIGAEDILISNYQTYISGLNKGIDPKTIILTNVKDHRALLEIKEDRTIFITTRSLSYLTKKINQTATIKNVVTKNNLEYFTTYETLEDVRKNMVTSKYNRFPVVDEHGCIKGMISKGSLLESKQKKAILVDHNEKGQSIDGIENITLLEVIDHHRVADIQTMGPLYFRVEPVGCTSTIVAKMYEENQVEISPIMAKVMLSAILSDTLLFKSPTSTDIDELTARKLASIADVNMESYGMAVIYAGSDFEHATPESILTTDVKPFMFGELKVMIAQTNTSDFNGFYKMYDETLTKMNQLCRVEQIDLYVLLVTDIVIGGTEMIVTGKSKWIAEQAFNIRPTENSIFLPNVFSRKKQVVPVLMQAAKL